MSWLDSHLTTYKVLMIFYLDRSYSVNDSQFLIHNARKFPLQSNCNGFIYTVCYCGLSALTRRLFLTALSQWPVWWEMTLSETFPIYIRVGIP